MIDDGQKWKNLNFTGAGIFKETDVKCISFLIFSMKLDKYSDNHAIIFCEQKEKTK